jgi:serine/threonine protein phosphatase 1
MSDLTSRTGLDNSITFVIGDIHGCFDKFLRLMFVCSAFESGQDIKFVLLGDYIDRGPQSREVIDSLMKRQTDPGHHLICLRGNHEELLIRAADKGRSDRDLMTWWRNGGEQTLASYGVGDPSDLPAEHLDWMRGLPLHTRDHHRIFVHAGIKPGIALSSQSEQDLLWIREPFLSSEEDHGAFVVHGHTPTPSRKPDLQPNRLNIDTGACYGGPLTAAAFSDELIAPLFFISDSGDVSTPAAGS